MYKKKAPDDYPKLTMYKQASFVVSVLLLGCFATTIPSIAQAEGIDGASQ